VTLARTKEGHLLEIRLALAEAAQALANPSVLPAMSKSTLIGNLLVLRDFFGDFPPDLAGHIAERLFTFILRAAVDGGADEPTSLAAIKGWSKSVVLWVDSDAELLDHKNVSFVPIVTMLQKRMEKQDDDFMEELATAEVEKCLAKDTAFLEVRACSTFVALS
jgi:hypothetical protein